MKVRDSDIFSVGMGTKEAESSTGRISGAGFLPSLIEVSDTCVAWSASGVDRRNYERCTEGLQLKA
jgi:hypothetical protein